ncbi:MAG: hypothetical protein A2268_06225 [Candidatus Raymondbacteria bacterium RifOxyA12_full_50_37]|uniref:HTH marR-type domain-containing protein n=1 Tax=Candidatus Raymondbacteria bacterium RIFOXYD12_FULL_49_13 TaxID=1817890 RepID=A0A1F7FKE4_UNCRA|nr:MAG: hypothetical protein A2268_06225 [Candidatus Raymondbacteria bacterium RifOxyA12_full_50_37]OGJ94565.1 MAG: hypothetical protein A2248_15155 [Candidatus Raymondbacteria bacterium RIFOXYA2_FULL_49_16]OGJ95893.1 MAG: hypothetical protein A2487_02950 [Candidatus Raymondbacteria bacterium RifOxyC12_full_50_8]OGK01714.1 MAG: hypothetical protein A2350_10885 [Candidatus Raymondbacteria bacterium RifOxyB12_full_50_8]OGK07041.1 MAG: hypothetical protein A2519_13795 [Candidatus Raymondbacteria b
MKQINVAALLRTFLINGPASQTQLVEITNLKKPTVSVLINQLKEQGLIFGTGSGNSSLQGGRKPQFIDINRTNIVGLGVSLRNLDLQFGLYDLQGKQIWQTAIQLGKNHSSIWAPIILKTIKKIQQRCAARQQVFLGTGFAIGCIFNPLRNNLNAISNNDEKDLSVNELFSSHLQNTAVVVDDFPNAMAIGEMWFGRAKDLSDFIYFQPVHPKLTIIIDKKIYRGHRFFAGEIGDCVMGAVPMRDLKGKAGFFTDAAFLQWLYELTLYYDPEKIIISAESAPAGLKDNLAAINGFIGDRYRERHPAFIKDDFIQFGTLDSSETVKGAVALVFENYFYSYKVQ